MTEHPWLKTVGIAGTLLPIAAAFIGLGIYVGNLTNQIETSRSEVQLLKGQVTQLQDILQKTQAASASSARGPKGDQGDQGEQGPRGERGPQGEPGPAAQASIDQATIASTVTKLVKDEFQKLAASISSSGALAINFLDSSNGLDLSKCISADTVKNAKTLLLKTGTEICGPDGEILERVSKVNNWFVSMHSPGGTNWTIKSDTKQGFRWDKGREFYLERITEDDDGGYIAAVRFRSKT